MRVSRLLGSNGHHKRHHKALHFGAVCGALRAVKGSQAFPSTKLAVELLTLTAARSGEVRGMRWHEVDLDAAIWTVPGNRMKAGREHRVPLSARAVEILREARAYSDGSDAALVFPSARGAVISDATMGKLLRENGYDATIHGMRSSFRQWCAERTNFPREVAELALAPRQSRSRRSRLSAKRSIREAPRIDGTMVSLSFGRWRGCCAVSCLNDRRSIRIELH